MPFLPILNNGCETVSVNNSVLLKVLISFAVGGLLGDVFLHILPYDQSNLPLLIHIISSQTPPSFLRFLLFRRFPRIAGDLCRRCHAMLGLSTGLLPDHWIKSWQVSVYLSIYLRVYVCRFICSVYVTMYACTTAIMYYVHVAVFVYACYITIR